MKWAPILLLIVVTGAFLLTAPQAEGALDAVTLWNEDFTDEATVIRDGAVIGITATDLNTTGGTRNATLSDPTNPGDSINVTLYDDGTNGDAVAGDGNYTGNFTVCSDGGTSGSCSSQSNATIDIAEGDPVSVYVDLDGDGSHSQVTVRTDYTGPGMATPFEGGFVSGQLIITITIIVEGEAELDPSSVTYSIDGGSSVAFVLIAPNTYQAVIDTTTLTDGPHSITTFSADEAGNVGSESFDMIVDNTVPDIDYGLATILPSGDVSVAVTVDDLHLDHSTILWRWDEGAWVNPGTSETPAVFNMVIAYDDMTPGNHSIEITAKDLANNSMTYILRFNLPEQSYGYITVPPPTIETGTVELGDTVTVGTSVDNDGEVPADVTVDLVVDGEVVDTVTVRVDGNSSQDIELEWPDVTEGEHEVQLVVTMPNATTGDDPVDTIPVTATGGGPIDISVPKLTVGRPVRVPTDKLEEGATLIIPAHVSNPGSVPRNAIVALLVDGKTKDSREVTVPGGGFLDLNLEWASITSGEHEIVIRVFMPDDYGTDPVDTVQVTDEEGGSVVVPPKEEWIEGFLSFLNPLYAYPPFSSVPDDWKPIFVPMVLVGIILGIALIGIGRARRKKKEAEVPDTDLKAVEMPPVTGTGAPTTPDAPVSLTEDGSTSSTPDDEEVVVVTPPDVSKTPSPGGPVPIPYPTTGGTSDTATSDEEGTTTATVPDESPATTPPPVIPPIASTTDEDDKGEPCVDIIKSYTRTREGADDAQSAATDAKDKENDAKDAAEEADRTAIDAEEKAKKAEKECEDARKAYDDQGVEEAEREAKEAEDRAKEMEDRLEELDGDIPPGDGVSLEPKPGYHEVGVGRGRMILPTSIYYRDAAAERAHLREIDKRYKEHKKLKREIDDAKEKAKKAREKANKASEAAKEAKKKADEACEKAKKAREEADRLRGAANDAQQKATAAGTDAQEAASAASAEDAAADAERKKVDDCKDCLAEVRRAKARIEELEAKLKNLRSGSQQSGPKGRHSGLDGKGEWDAWWDSFKRFRDETKRIADIKNFTDAELPSEFTGIWDWGGPVGTAVGYGAEDISGAVIPTDTIKAVGGLYAVFQASFDPKTALGARILYEHLTDKEAKEAADAFEGFPRVMRDAVKSFEKLQRLAELDAKIKKALDKWKDCLDILPQAPPMPEIDMDNLCYQQCLELLEKLKAHEKKLRELIQQAEDCKPSDLDDMLDEAEGIKAGLKGIKNKMDRTRKGLENYRKAQRANKKCYISTAAYGTPMAPELDMLRGFRDRVLFPTPGGRLLVDHYYRSAPAIADRLETRAEDKESVRGTIGLAVRLIHAREGRGPVTGALLSMVTVGVYAIGSLQAWLLTRR
jgi:chemotaxis protein histidine kinase CheA